MQVRLTKMMILKSIATSFILIPFATITYSFELSGNLAANVEYTDNARTVSTHRQEDIIQKASAEIGMLEERKNIRADANIRLEYEHYTEDTFDDEISLTSGFGLFSIDLVEEFFNWQATFSRTDVLADSSQDENPDTREFRNILRTGPTISYAITRAMHLRAEANYVVLENSEATAVDSERFNGRLNYDFQYNSLTSIVAGASYDGVIESDDSEDITNTNVNVGFVRRLVDGELSFTYGLQEVNSNVQITEDSDETDSNFLEFKVSKEHFLGQNIELSYREDVTDTSIGFEADESGNIAENARANGVSITDIEKRKQALINVTREFDAFSYDVNAIYQESSFERIQSVERYRRITIGVQPKVYSRLVPQFQYSYTREDFGIEIGLGEDILRGYQFSGQYQVVQSIFINAFVNFEKIHNGKNASRESEELSIGAGVSWDFL